MKPNRTIDPGEIRRRAEEQLQNRQGADAPISSHEMQRLLQELKIHQIELEMQNEELQRAYAELEVSRERYFDLYDLAPVCYATVNEAGIILEANLTTATMLGVARGALAGLPLSRFIQKDDADRYHLHRRQLFKTTETQTCELRMVKPDKTTCWIQMAMSITQQLGAPECRMVFNDITERKRAEEEILQHVEALERFNKAAVDRELRMVELKKEVNELLARAGEQSRYPLDFKEEDLHPLGSEEAQRERPGGQQPHSQADGLSPVHRGGAATGALPAGHRRAAEIGGSAVPARTLRLLLIEDEEDDAIMTIEELRKGGYAPDVTRVDTPAALEAALENDGWDAVIADYSLPSFTGIDALRIVQAKGIDVPFILVSGAICEERATEVLKAGFHDFIVKGHLARLAQVLKRELRVVQRTAEVQAANAKLRASHAATLNLMEDAVIARNKANEISDRLRLEILERKNIEEALHRSEEQLQALNEGLEREVEQRTRELRENQLQLLHAEKLTIIGKLSASVAHEFNNPLMSIMTILKGLKMRAILEEEDRHFLDAAITESARMRDLLRNLQGFNRRSSARKELVDVRKTIDSVLLLQKSDLKTRRISVVLDYVEHLPPILAIPDQIKQVFLNLLTNAADACHQDGGEITISTWQEDQRVAVAIKDTGTGIEPEKMDQLFQPFYTTKPGVKGTGLGLSVSDGIIKNHKGEIRVESRPGEGSTFTVLLPVSGT